MGKNRSNIKEVLENPKNFKKKKKKRSKEEIDVEVKEVKDRDRERTELYVRKRVIRLFRPLRPCRCTILN
jgi:hypothetical protein